MWPFNYKTSDSSSISISGSGPLLPQTTVNHQYQQPQLTLGVPLYAAPTNHQYAYPYSFMPSQQQQHLQLQHPVEAAAHVGTSIIDYSCGPAAAMTAAFGSNVSGSSNMAVVTSQQQQTATYTTPLGKPNIFSQTFCYYRE